MIDEKRIEELREWVSSIHQFAALDGRKVDTENAHDLVFLLSEVPALRSEVERLRGDRDEWEAKARRGWEDRHAAVGMWHAAEELSEERQARAEKAEADLADLRPLREAAVWNTAEVLADELGQLAKLNIIPAIGRPERFAASMLILRAALGYCSTTSKRG
jgi:hypothetical protein